MILFFIPLFALFNACSLVNRDLPNEAPVLQASRIDTLQVRRGGEIPLQIRASDEDDDPLYYAWEAFRVHDDVLRSIESLTPDGIFTEPQQIRSLQGLLQLAEPIGGFRDSTAQVLNSWFAPTLIQGNAERFLLAVAIRDRFCDIIADPTDHQACTEVAFQVIQTFVVEVVQRPPTIAVTADTAIPFRTPLISLEARLADPDGDPLTVDWSRLEGPELDFQVQRAAGGRLLLEAVPFFPGDYRFLLAVTDGADTVDAEFAVHLFPDPAPPAGGMVDLTLADGSTYAIDVYEYPNEQGRVPLLAASWFQAAQLCAAQGKRLCTRDEWFHACRGGDNRRYSSTDDPFDLLPRPFGRRFCNTTGSELAPQTPDPAVDQAASGTFPNCASSFGVYDLTGNLREWVARSDSLGQTRGGRSESDVQDIVPDDCGTFTELASLPLGLEYTNPAEVGLLGPEYDTYLEAGIGFRCCR